MKLSAWRWTQIKIIGSKRTCKPTLRFASGRTWFAGLTNNVINFEYRTLGSHLLYSQNLWTNPPLRFGTDSTYMFNNYMVNCEYWIPGSRLLKSHHLSTNPSLCCGTVSACMFDKQCDHLRVLDFGFPPAQLTELVNQPSASLRDGLILHVVTRQHD